SCHDQAAIAGARKSRDGAFDFGGVAHVDRDNLHAAGRCYRLYDRNCPVPAAIAGSRRTAARVRSGAISLSSSTHFPLRLYSNIKKPVALPPGRDRLSMKPEPSGSGTTANTIGTARVACSNRSKPRPPFAKMTSGACAANSAACLRILSAPPPPQRYSIATL